jgi:hypothetical protein
MANAGWQMANAGWRMEVNRCRDEMGPPTFPRGRKVGGPCRSPKNAECGIRKEKWQMADGEWQMADDKRKVSQGRIVGYDSNRVIDDSTNDKMGTLSHQAAEKSWFGDQ